MVTIHDVINSEGMRFLNRMHERSFSINIFRLNAHELIAFLSGAKDVNRAITSFNTPVSKSEMIECARLLHNFVASAMTLIEHTRNFFKKHYPKSEINRAYSELVKEKFERNESTRFIQDMRNFMVHKGLLPIERHITFTQDPGTGDQVGEAGFQLIVPQLLEWDNWKPEVKKFLAKQPEKIDLLPIVNDYTQLIESFQDDLDDRLRLLHSDDVLLMQALQRQLDEERVQKVNVPPKPEL